MKIKNKFLIFILCLCLIIPTMFILSACDMGKDKDIQVRVDNGYVQWSYDNENWTNVISIDEIKNSLGDDLKGEKGDNGTQGKPGVDGKEVEFQKTNTHIQWRYVGESDSAWRSLVELSALKGDDGEDRSYATYTVTLDYGIAKDLFENTDNFVDDNKEIKSTEWLTGLPTINDEYKDSFLGWFVSGTNKKISNYDFIGDSVSLEAKFDVKNEKAPSGLYKNGKYVKTWQDIKNVRPDAFDGTLIKGKSFNDSYGGSYFTSPIQYLYGELVIDNTITDIGQSAFRGCEKLVSVTIPSSVKTINRYAFSCCSMLSNITILNGVKEIAYGAFSECVSLKNIEIPEGVTSLERTFADCTNLINVTIPSSVTYIGSGVFYNCTSLASIIIPSSITYIGIGAFWNCTSLTSVIIPSSVTSIGSQVFYNCTSLTSVTILYGLTDLTDYTFKNCTSLINITIPSSVTSFDTNVFENCTSLKNIIIPSSVKRIGSYSSNNIFLGCTSLENVFYGGSESEWKSISIRGDLDIADKLKYYSISQPMFVENIDQFWHYVEGIPTIWKYVY